MEITELPFNRFIGIKRSRTEGSELSLDGDYKYTNHLGTVHAGALLALAEAASGEYLIQTLSGIGFEVVPVVRRLEAKFRKPAQGAIFSRLEVPEQKKDELLAALQAKGRALVEIPVEIHDENGTQALSATVEWFVAKRV